MLRIIALLIIATGASGQVLTLDGVIAMPEVQGRIDHLSLDATGRRLFVAALGNNTVEVIDLEAKRRIRSIPGLQEPQGVLYLPKKNRLYVANGSDGTVRIFDGGSLRQLQSISFGEDADNLRYDTAHDRVYVGYGDGGLGEFTPDGRRTGDIPLDAHPESFQLEKAGARIFVNLPKSQKIGVVDRQKRTAAAEWRTGGPRANFPMALDEANHRLFVLCRAPARLVVLDSKDGRRLADVATLGDADDVFYDAETRRIYAIGGEGAVWVHEAGRYTVIARIPTAPGARTGLFSPELKQLFVALRQHAGKPAEVRVYAVRP